MQILGVAAAILLLAEDGRLSVDDPVRKWLPELPPIAAPISLRRVKPVSC